MGVKDLWTLLKAYSRRVDIATLRHKTLAIDASIWLTQFVKAMRNSDGTMMHNAHIVGCFRRIMTLLFHRIRPVFVFDGGAPMLKRRTVLLRQQQRERKESQHSNAARKILLGQMQQKLLQSQIEAAPDYEPFAAGSHALPSAAGKGTDLATLQTQIKWLKSGKGQLPASSKAAASGAAAAAVHVYGSDDDEDGEEEDEDDGQWVIEIDSDVEGSGAGTAAGAASRARKTVQFADERGGSSSSAAAIEFVEEGGDDEEELQRAIALSLGEPLSGGAQLLGVEGDDEEEGGPVILRRAAPSSSSSAAAAAAGVASASGDSASPQSAAAAHSSPAAAAEVDGAGPSPATAQQRKKKRLRSAFDVEADGDAAPPSSAFASSSSAAAASSGGGGGDMESSSSSQSLLGGGTELGARRAAGSASSAAAAASRRFGEEEDEDEEVVNGIYSEVFLPQVPDSVGDVDLSIVASLPAHLQKDYVDALRRNQRSASVRALLPLAADPSAFSRSQMESFLASAKFNTDVGALNASMAASVAQVGGRKIASEADREYLFLRSSDGPPGGAGGGASAVAGGEAELARQLRRMEARARRVGPGGEEEAEEGGGGGGWVEDEAAARSAAAAPASSLGNNWVAEAVAVRTAARNKDSAGEGGGALAAATCRPSGVGSSGGPGGEASALGTAAAEEPATELSDRDKVALYVHAHRRNTAGTAGGAGSSASGGHRGGARGGAGFRGRGGGGGRSKLARRLKDGNRSMRSLIDYIDGRAPTMDGGVLRNRFDQLLQEGRDQEAPLLPEQPLTSVPLESLGKEPQEPLSPQAASASDGVVRGAAGNEDDDDDAAVGGDGDGGEAMREEGGDASRPTRSMGEGGATAAAVTSSSSSSAVAAQSQREPQPQPRRNGTAGSRPWRGGGGRARDPEAERLREAMRIAFGDASDEDGEEEGSDNNKGGSVGDEEEAIVMVAGGSEEAGSGTGTPAAPSPPTSGTHHRSSPPPADLSSFGGRSSGAGSSSPAGATAAAIATAASSSPVQTEAEQGLIPEHRSLQQQPAPAVEDYDETDDDTAVAFSTSAAERSRPLSGIFQLQPPRTGADGIFAGTTAGTRASTQVSAANLGSARAVSLQGEPVQGQHDVELTGSGGSDSLPPSYRVLPPSYRVLPPSYRVGDDITGARAAAEGSTSPAAAGEGAGGEGATAAAGVAAEEGQEEAGDTDGGGFFPGDASIDAAAAIVAAAAAATGSSSSRLPRNLAAQAARDAAPNAWSVYRPLPPPQQQQVEAQAAAAGIASAAGSAAAGASAAASAGASAASGLPTEDEEHRGGAFAGPPGLPTAAAAGGAPYPDPHGTPAGDADAALSDTGVGEGEWEEVEAAPAPEGEVHVQLAMEEGVGEEDLASELLAHALSSEQQPGAGNWAERPHQEEEELPAAGNDDAYFEAYVKEREDRVAGATGVSSQLRAGGAAQASRARHGGSGLPPRRRGEEEGDAPAAGAPAGSSSSGRLGPGTAFTASIAAAYKVAGNMRGYAKEAFASSMRELGIELPGEEREGAAAATVAAAEEDADVKLGGEEDGVDDCVILVEGGGEGSSSSSCAAGPGDAPNPAPSAADLQAAGLQALFDSLDGDSGAYARASSAPASSAPAAPPAPAPAVPPAPAPRPLADLQGDLVALRAEESALRGSAARAARDSDFVTDSMLRDVMELLELFGLPYVMAPMEAEAQCAALELGGLVDGVVTEDSDVFLFGSAIVYRNIFDDKKWVEEYRAADIEARFGLSRDDLIRSALLLGSDYTEGVAGVGPVNAAEILAAFPGDEGLVEFREWLRGVEPDPRLGKKALARASPLERFKHTHRNARKRWSVSDGFPSRSVLAAYRHPTVKDLPDGIAFRPTDFEGLHRLCVAKLGWSASRAATELQPLQRELATGRVQSTLDAFVRPTRYEDGALAARIRSSRLGAAVKGMAARAPAPGAAAAVEELLLGAGEEEEVVEVEVVAAAGKRGAGNRGGAGGRKRRGALVEGGGRRAAAPAQPSQGGDGGEEEEVMVVEDEEEQDVVVVNARVGAPRAARAAAGAGTGGKQATAAGGAGRHSDASSSPSSPSSSEEDGFRRRRPLKKKRRAPGAGGK